MVGVVTDGAISQPGRGPSQHEPGQQIGLIVRELFLARHRPPLTQIPHRHQRQLTPPNFTLSDKNIDGMRNEAP
jgi:hypothetical protein